MSGETRGRESSGSAVESKRWAGAGGDAPWMRAGKPVLRVGHRGAGAFEPQNTLRSFDRALNGGVEMVEVDLRQTADGALVLAHDDDLHGEDGRRLLIAEASLADLREIDLGHGERIPTLEEALEFCRGRGAMMIDLKGEGFEADLVALLRRIDFTDVIIPGGSRLSRERIRALNPRLPLSLSLDRGWKDRIDDALFASLDTDAVTWQYPLLDEPTVSRLHKMGRWVFAWTVDDAEEMARLVSIGVDGIISNRTDLLTNL